MNRSDLEKFLAAIERVQREHTTSREKARRFLQDEGVLTQLGQLSEFYGASEPHRDERLRQDADASTRRVEA